LPPIDAIEQAGGVHKFRDHLLFAITQVARIEGHLDGLEFRERCRNIGRDDELLGRLRKSGCGDEGGK